MAIQIKIYYGYANGDLELSDKGYSEVDKGNALKWKIEDRASSGSIIVASLVAIKIKPTSSGEIFSERPSKDADEWKAKIKDEESVRGKTCEYAIHWKDEKGREYVCDPIIAVKP